MKKTFWGFDPREVNETIEFLENQNESLTAKLANLNLELSVKNEQLASKSSEESESSNLIEKERAQILKLQEEISRLTNDNKQLKVEAGDLASKIQRLENQKGKESQPIVSDAQDELQRVGAICQVAYADMALAKKQTAEEMRRFADEYFGKIEGYDVEMRQAISDIIAAKYKAKNSFIETVEEILSKFEIFGDESAQINVELDNVISIKKGLMNNVESLIQSLDPEEDLREKAEEQETDENGLFPPLLSRALSNKKVKEPDLSGFEDNGKSGIDKEYKQPRSIVKLKSKTEKKEDDNSVVDISVDVNAKDVFRANM